MNTVQSAVKVWVLVGLTAIFLGGGCPATDGNGNGNGSDGGGDTAQPATLYTGTIASQGVPLITQFACPNADNGSMLYFSTTAAGKLVTATVTGPSSMSRPQIQVLDMFMAELANTGPTPTAQGATATFTPTSAGQHMLLVNECTAGITGNYTVLITQAP